jgi:hypothetical protein
MGNPKNTPSDPFVHDEIPAKEILSHGFSERIKGGEVYTAYSSSSSKLFTFLGTRGLKPMDHMNLGPKFCSWDFNDIVVLNSKR